MTFASGHRVALLIISSVVCVRSNPQKKNHPMQYSSSILVANVANSKRQTANGKRQTADVSLIHMHV
jgi:hypothetical protein